MNFKRFNAVWIVVVGVIGVSWLVFGSDHSNTYDLDWLDVEKPHENVGYDLIRSNGGELKSERELSASDITLEHYDRLVYEYVSGVEQHFNEYSPYLNTQYANPQQPVYPQQLNMFTAYLHDEAVYFFTVTNGSVPDERVNQHEQLMVGAKGIREGVSRISSATIMGSIDELDAGIELYGESYAMMMDALNVK